jgi:hypothetical protein
MDGDSHVATGLNNGVASFSSWSISMSNLEMGIPYKHCLLLKVNTVKVFGKFELDKR